MPVPPGDLTKHRLHRHPVICFFLFHTQVINSKLHLISIHRLGVRANAHTCVVDQEVKSLLSWKIKDYM